tara:strand:+ start:2583 stop:2768 length:186 start_codon:yes stop_codon:yes gene_type:complete
MSITRFEVTAWRDALIPHTVYTNLKTRSTGTLTLSLDVFIDAAVAVIIDVVTDLFVVGCVL